MRLTPLESVLNRNISASSRARELCRRLDGKTLALHVAGVRASVYFHAQGEAISIASRSEVEPAATLSGSPLALLKLAGAAPESAIRGGGVHISGDAEVAQTFRDLLNRARPDLEEELARVIGDVAAHQVGNAVRGVVSFGRRAADTFAQNVAEFLQEEGRDVPSRTEAEEFTAGVDHVRDDVDRLEARLALLERRLATEPNK
jgi:ubiquinone biosynthesis protein UbiJ